MAGVSKSSVIILLCFSFLSQARSECSVMNDGGGVNLDDLPLLPYPDSGIYIMFLSSTCEGTLTSIRARGLCPTEIDGKPVVLQIANGTSRIGFIDFDVSHLPVQCQDGVSEVSVSIDNLNIAIRPTAFLAVNYSNEECNDEMCFFIPALVNQGREGDFLSIIGDNFTSQIDGSTFLLSATIDDGTERESSITMAMIAGSAVASCVAVCIVIVVAVSVLCILCVRSTESKKKIAPTPSESNHLQHTEVNPSMTNELETTLPLQQQVNGQETLPEEDGELARHSYVDIDRSTRQHYEFDVENREGGGAYDYAVRDDGHFCSPPNSEEELRAQLHFSGVLHIPDDNIRLLDELGSGEFGVVRRGVWSAEGGEEREVAVKSLADGSTEEKRIQFLQEAAIMGQFKHPNVITLHGVLLDSDPLRLIVELMLKGNLNDYLPVMRQNLSGANKTREVKATLLCFCRHIASGMTYLSGKGFIHRDLAARNVLVSYGYVCKIADFGMSRTLQDADYYVSRGGKIPVKWTAPEALSYKKYSTASDVWSFGMVMYEIWTLGFKPFHNLTNAKAYHEIIDGHILSPPPGCPRSVYWLMLQCWKMDPEKRPQFPNLQLWLQKPDFEILTWTAADMAAYTEEARTLGAPIEAGEDLYRELRIKK